MAIPVNVLPKANGFSFFTKQKMPAISSGMNYDLQSNEVEQFDIGFTRLRWPNLTYYIGSRYLRSTNIDGEKGSNAVTFAATYRINPRYMVSISHQYDYDYGKLIISEISLQRRYHRIVYGFTASRDESLDRDVVMFCIWPEGVSELSMGSGSVLNLDSPQSRGY